MTNQNIITPDPNHRERRASHERASQYIVGQIHQGPNSFGLICTEKGVPGSAPIRIDVNEDLFTDGELKQVHDALELLESKFAIAHQHLEDELEIQGLKAPRDKVHALVKEAQDARTTLTDTATAQEALLVEAQAKLNVIINAHAQIDNALVEKRVAVEKMDEQIDKTADQLGAHQTALAAKAAEIAHLDAAIALQRRQYEDLVAQSQMATVVAAALAAKQTASQPTEEKSDGT